MAGTLLRSVSSLRCFDVRAIEKTINHTRDAHSYTELTTTHQKKKGTGAESAAQVMRNTERGGQRVPSANFLANALFVKRLYIPGISPPVLGEYSWPEATYVEPKNLKVIT